MALCTQIRTVCRLSIIIASAVFWTDCMVVDNILLSRENSNLAFELLKLFVLNFILSFLVESPAVLLALWTGLLLKFV